jgi:hypothetical protein
MKAMPCQRRGWSAEGLEFSVGVYLRMAFLDFKLPNRKTSPGCERRQSSRRHSIVAGLRILHDSKQFLVRAAQGCGPRVLEAKKNPPPGVALALLEILILTAFSTDRTAS